MKMWLGYGSEHSANLVLIGKFSSAKTAQEALDLLNLATEIATADEAAGRLKPGEITRKFSDQILDLMRTHNFASFGYGDPEELLYEYNAHRDGDRVVLTTEESSVSAFLKIFLHSEAKIEIYSAHDHGGIYGRRTHGQ